MASRPIFMAQREGPNLVTKQSVEFEWHAGMAMSRKQMSMRSLHAQAQALHPDARILEVSRMSDTGLGEQLSAFNLLFDCPGKRGKIPVECVFQASKVFERGGPFVDLLSASPFDAKRDARLQSSGDVVGFRLFDQDWPNQPETAFYDWVYIKALHQHPHLASDVLGYDVFTDIAFNPKKSINCQANAVALYVALVRRGELEEALLSKEAFLGVEAHLGSTDGADGAQGILF
jgi:hypothetical protein